jgi:hypothetical protein
MPRKHRRDPSYHQAPSAPQPSRRSDPPMWALVPGYDVRHVTSDKGYRCPGCDHMIRAGTWHLVVVPTNDVDYRRHWHTECWRRELRRMGLATPPRP